MFANHKRINFPLLISEDIDRDGGILSFKPIYSFEVDWEGDVVPVKVIISIFF